MKTEDCSMACSAEDSLTSLTFEQLAQEERGRLYRVAVRITGSPADADDAMQDALLSAFRSWRRFRGDAPRSAWLYRITVNAARKIVERRQRHQSAPEGWADAILS